VASNRYAKVIHPMLSKENKTRIYMKCVRSWCCKNKGLLLRY